jgi:hypothetical protein
LNAKKFRTPNGKLFQKTSVKRLIDKWKRKQTPILE